MFENIAKEPTFNNTPHTHTHTHTPTPTESDRVNGNKKGVLTRQRQPKAAARLLRQRYLTLAAGFKDGTCPIEYELMGLREHRIFVNQ